MNITSTTGTSGANTAAEPAAARLPQQTLGQEDFLKLLTVQLSKQDPMAPMTDQSFIAQMAQFSSLQQASEMAKDMSLLRADGQMQAASVLIGKEVTVAMADGDITGTVSEVASDGGMMHVKIGDTYYPYQLVYRVSSPTEAPTPAPADNTTS